MMTLNYTFNYDIKLMIRFETSINIRSLINV